MKALSLGFVAVLGPALSCVAGSVQTNLHVLPPRKVPAPFAELRRLPPPEPLPPGVYEAKPSTALVLVPRANIDPGIVANPGAREFPMPTKKPDLRLVPRVPKK